MKITATATEQITTVDGVKARVWLAETESGVKFLMFVSRMAVDVDADQSEFERALQSMPAPREVRTVDVFDRRLLS